MKRVWRFRFSAPRYAARLSTCCTPTRLRARHIWRSSWAPGLRPFATIWKRWRLPGRSTRTHPERDRGTVSSTSSTRTASPNSTAYSAATCTPSNTTTASPSSLSSPVTSADRPSRSSTSPSSCATRPKALTFITLTEQRTAHFWHPVGAPAHLPPVASLFRARGMGRGRWWCRCG